MPFALLPDRRFRVVMSGYSVLPRFTIEAVAASLCS